MINGFEGVNLSILFSSFEMMIFYYGLIFVVLPFFFPKICLLPIWLGLLLTLSFALFMAIDSIEAMYEPTNFYYSYPYDIRLKNVLKTTAYCGFISFLLVILARPALFYARFISRKLFT